MSCRSSSSTRESRRAPPLRSGLIALAFFLAGADAVPVRADDGLDSRARDVLAAHCAPCRETGRRGAPLDLAAIARDPTLVRPGNPDGSPAYTSTLRQFGGNSSSPTTGELATLRAWIASLPATAARCASASFPPRVRIEVALARVATAVRKPISAFRVLSLGHLDLGCPTAEQTGAWRQTIGLVVGAMAGKAQPAGTHALDNDGRLIAIDIEALGWDGTRWRALLGMSPGGPRPDEPLVVRADLFIARALRGATVADLADISDADRQTARSLLGPLATPDSLEQHIDIMLQLARQHLAPLGLARVAAEMGVRPEMIEQNIEYVAKIAPDPWLRLAYASVPRAEIERNWALIARSAGLEPPAHADASARVDPAPPAATATEAPIDITIYPDRLRYAPGDALQLTIRTNADCHLTVISIDTLGHGTVIFPNDFAAENRVRAHIDLNLPAKGARYRFRLKSKGREHVVALCTRADGSVDGIQHNFERQRFQELGLYSDFIDAALRRALPTAVERNGAPPVPENQISRTGIVIDVR